MNAISGDPLDIANGDRTPWSNFFSGLFLRFHRIPDRWSESDLFFWVLRIFGEYGSRGAGSIRAED